MTRHPFKKGNCFTKKYQASEWTSHESQQPKYIFTHQKRLSFSRGFVRLVDPSGFRDESGLIYLRTHLASPCQWHFSFGRKHHICLFATWVLYFVSWPLLQVVLLIKYFVDIKMLKRKLSTLVFWYVPHLYLLLNQTSSRLRFIRHLQIGNGGTWQLTATHNDIVDRDEHELHRVANEAWMFSPSLEIVLSKRTDTRKIHRDPTKSYLYL